MESLMLCPLRQIGVVSHKGPHVGSAHIASSERTTPTAWIIVVVSFFPGISFVLDGFQESM